jgi:hypothetical protein
MLLFIKTYNKYRIRRHNVIDGYVNSIPKVLYNYPKLRSTEFYSILLDTDYKTIR